MLILGVDPSGESNVGLALLSVSQGARATFVSGARASAGCDLRDYLRDVDVVAIEWPSVGPRQAMKAVLATMSEAGRIEGIASFVGARVVRVAANDWRRAIVGKTRRAGSMTIDRMTQNAVDRQVDRLPRRCSCHVRDAVGVALYAWRIARP